MKERPILFSTPMVQAILEGRKTQTRRVVKTTANNIYWQPIVLNGYGGFVDEHGNPVRCKKDIGDLLWVKETFQPLPDFQIKYRYKADHLRPADVEWKPSIFMPKAAARIWLKIENIKVDRLQDISEEDAISEGVESDDKGYFKDYMNQRNGYCLRPGLSFISLWQSINGEESWNANPWVWVIEFKKIKK